MSGRAGKGRTFDPCHGCGNAPENWNGRPKTGLCETCRGALDFALKIADEQAKLGDESVTLAAPERDYALPYLHDTEREAREKTMASFHKLSFLLSKPDGSSSTNYYGKELLWPSINQNQRSEWLVPRVFSRPVADTLRELYAAVNDAILAAHRIGAESGQNLLMQLADGSITNDQFNDRAARLKGEES